MRILFLLNQCLFIGSLHNSVRRPQSGTGPSPRMFGRFTTSSCRYRFARSARALSVLVRTDGCCLPPIASLYGGSRCRPHPGIRPWLSPPRRGVRPRPTALHLARPTLIACVALSFMHLGCDNPPNALTLRITPAKGSFNNEEPIRLTATFAASDGTVCINKPKVDAFNVELHNVESGEQLHETVIAYCGMLGLLRVPLYPALYASSYLDLADASHRFAVVGPSKAYDFSFIVLGTERGFIVFEDNDPDFPEWERRSKTLPAGRYMLRMRFQSEPSPFYPPPLFWSVYEQAVEASATFTVVDEPTMESATNGDLSPP